MSATSPAHEKYWDVECDTRGCEATIRSDNPRPPKGSGWTSTISDDYCPVHTNGSANDA